MNRPGRSRQRGYFSVDMAVAVLGLVVLAGAAGAAMSAALESRDRDAKAAWLASQLTAHAEAQLAGGRARAVGRTDGPVIDAPFVGVRAGAACLLDGGDAGFAAPANALDAALTCRFCSNMGSACDASPAVARCATMTSMRTALAAAPETARAAAPGHVEAVFGVFLPAVSVAEAGAIQARLERMMQAGALPGWAGTSAQLAAGGFQASPARPALTFSRQNGGLMVCF